MQKVASNLANIVHAIRNRWVVSGGFPLVRNLLVLTVFFYQHVVTYL